MDNGFTEFRTERASGSRKLASWQLALRLLENARKRPLDHVDSCEAGTERRGDLFLTPKSSGQLAADGPGGVGVVAEVDGPQDRLFECAGVMKGPQGRLQALHHPTRA